MNGGYCMDEMDKMKAEMGRVLSKKGKKGSKPDKSVELPDPTELQCEDIMVILHKDEVSVILDLLYEGLESSKSLGSKRAMLNVIKHIEA